MTVQKLSEATRPTGVGRRTLVTGSAWAVPVVAVGAAAPMAAASCVVVITFDEVASCKCPGNSTTYTLSFCATSTCSSVTGQLITITDIKSTTGGGTSMTVKGGVYPSLTINGACSEPVVVYGSGNAANFLEVHYAFADGTTGFDDQVPNPPRECDPCPTVP